MRMAFFLVLICASYALALNRSVTAREQLARAVSLPQKFSINAQRGIIEFAGACEASRSQYRVNVDAAGNVLSVSRRRATASVSGFLQIPKLDLRPLIKRFRFRPLLLDGKTASVSTVFTVECLK